MEIISESLFKEKVRGENTGKVVDSVGNAILGGLGLDDPYRVEA